MQAAVTAAARAQSLLRIIAFVAAVGIVISSVSLVHHFAKSKTSFCDIGQSFNCDLVNRSQYSVVAGVPVALIGIVGYISLLALATFYRRNRETPLILAIASAAGLAFALRLTYIEARVLYAWCILCLSSLTAIALITLLSAIAAAQSSRTTA